LNKKILFTAIILLGINLLMKILFLCQSSIAWDEPFSIYYAQMQPRQIVKHLLTGNNPPGFELMLHCWIKVFGISPFSVRFLPVVFSSLTAVLLFLLGKKVFNYRTGLIAALIFSFSSYHLFFAHEARVYSLFALLTVSSFYLFIESIRVNNKRYFIALAVLNAVMLYMHYFGFFVILIQAISICSTGDLRRKYLSRFGAACTGTLVLFLPNLKILWERFQDSASNGTWIEKPNSIDSLYTMVWRFSNQPVVTVICLSVLLAALFKLLVNQDFKRIQTEKRIIAIWFLFPFFFMFLISYEIPIFLDRYLVFVSLGYYLLIAVSLDYLFKAQVLTNVLAVSVVSLFAVTFRPNLDNKRHAVEAVNKVKELKDKNTSLIICAKDFVLNFAYYYDRSLFSNVDKDNVYDNMILEFNKQSIFPCYSIPDGIQLKFKVIYLDAAADFTTPGNNILKSLSEKYTLKQVYHFETIFNVYEFEAIEGKKYTASLSKSK
jgi:mannosyltransferase